MSDLVAADPEKQKRYSPEEYLALEAEAEIWHEYRDGKIVERDPSTITHNQLTGNLAVSLLQAFRGKDFHVFAIDLRLWIPHANFFVYPDVMVIQGEPLCLDESQTTITNPIFVAEVFSSSTQNYDQGEKFDVYRSIPNFSEYLLIDQYQCYVRHFAKTAENQWLLTDCKDINSTISFTSINFDLVLAELYKGITFE